MSSALLRGGVLQPRASTLLVAFVLIVGACGGSDAEPTATSAPLATTTTLESTTTMAPTTTVTPTTTTTTVAPTTTEAVPSLWTNVELEESPGPRGYHSVVYDSESDRILLFSGEYRGPTDVSYNDTWAFDANAGNWEMLEPEVTPGRAGAYGFAYDSESDRAVLFSGGGFPTKETWSYDYNSNTWTEMTPEISPPGRIGHEMVYDSESDLIVMYGGVTPSFQPLEDTWTYDLNANVWTEMSPATYPDHRLYYTMAYDPPSDRVILFGGGSGGPTYKTIFDETWAYDADTDSWELLAPATNPPPRVYAESTYSEVWGGIVLFGGGTQSFDEPLLDDHLMGEIWVYDSTTNEWKAEFLSGSPSGRKKHAVAFDSESQLLILFGGDTWDSEGKSGDYQNETWLLSPPDL